MMSSKILYKITVDPKLVYNPTEKYSSIITRILRIFSRHGLHVKICNKTDLIETDKLCLEFSELKPVLDELVSVYPTLEQKPVAFALTVEEHWTPIVRNIKVEFKLNTPEEG